LNIAKCFVDQKIQEPSVIIGGKFEGATSSVKQDLPMVVETGVSDSSWGGRIAYEALS
jgi:hypothetical protein